MLPPRIRSPLSVLIFISYLGLSNLTSAEQTREECEISTVKQYYELYRDTAAAMKLCPLWAAVCSHFYRNCPTTVSCEFTNYDPKITAQYDPSSPTSHTNFLHCTSCGVNMSVDPVFFGTPSVPTQNGQPLSESFPRGVDDTNIGSLLPDASPEDMLAERPSISIVTGTITAIFVLGGVIGSLIAGFLASVGAAAQTAGGQFGIDAITLLLHFQSVSISGLLSLSYPTLYRFFTYNFAWSNLIISAFTDAARQLGADPSCLHNLGSLGPNLTNDTNSPTGMTVMAARYDLDRTSLGGLAYIGAIIVGAAGLVVFFLLELLGRIFRSKKYRGQVPEWPSKASSLTVGLFLWISGSISTFAIYQFVDPCSSPSLIAFASVEFALIHFILFGLSIVIIYVAQSKGRIAIFPPEGVKYSRKLGSLYVKLKEDLYWYFIPEYLWVLVRSVIVGVGQGSGLAQVCALIGLESAILIVLLMKRPYKESRENYRHIVSTCKRLFTSASLLVFWSGFNISTDTKQKMGITLIFFETLFAVVLFVFLLLEAGSAIIDQYKRRKATSDTSTATPPP